MKHKICLHGLGLKNKGQLLTAVQKLLPPSTVKSKIKEKYLAHEDMLKYKRTRFVPLNEAGYKLTCINGVMVISDTIYPLNEVIIQYEEEAVQEVHKLLQKLLGGKMKFVLDEPDLVLRAKQQRGRSSMKDMEQYDEDDLATALRCHLPWHVFGASKAWGDLLTCSNERNLVRQLRVKLRRLRSSLTFFKELIPLTTFEQHKMLVKRWANVLGDAREYDVALLTCMKIRHGQRTEEAVDEVSRLEEILLEYRARASKRVLNASKLNGITLQFAEMLLTLQNTALPEAYEDVRLKSFIRQRLNSWCNRLILLPEKYPDFADMEQLHKIRIKMKRFRYGLQGVPEIDFPTSLLRSLKSFQDMLGFLHDDYVNDMLIEEILQQYPDDPALQYEGAMFCGWERAKAEAALASLPELWDNFTVQLREWQEDTL
ncbi:MAG: CHAD domain-containing protein [Phascolarctobacterium sp.]|nr:CHAD domain-containing protein [Phascolarctobacterium sp.]